MGFAVKTLVALLFAYGIVTITVYQYVVYQEYQCNKLIKQGQRCDPQYIKILRFLNLPGG